MVSRIALTMLDIFSAGSHYRGVRRRGYFLIYSYQVVHQLVSVKTFAGKAKAMDYYNFMKGNQFVYSDLEAGTYQTFIISAENYSIFYKDKNINEYKQFFTQNFK
jgi:hypothetical protein